MDNKFNLNKLWTLYSATNNETLSLSVYGGTASLVVFKKDSESKKPVVKMNLNIPALRMIGNLLKSLKDAQPGTRSPFVQRQYNKDSREYVQVCQFVFTKDEKRIYGLEVSNKFVTTPIKFVFRVPDRFALGSESLSDETRSLLGLEEFLYWVNDGLKTAMLLSRFNMDPPQNRGGNGNSNRNNGSYSRASSNPDNNADPFNDSDSAFD